jgi:hypothetical protein
MNRQRPNKTVTSAYTISDSDAGSTIKCDSATGFEVTLPSAVGRINFDVLLINIGAGSIVCNVLTIEQNSHAHVACDGSSWFVAIGGGGSSTEVDPVFESWLATTPPVMSETDPDFNASAAASITVTDLMHFTTGYSHSQTAHAPSDAQKNSDITMPEIEAKLVGKIASHYHSIYEPLVNGDPLNPEVMFDDLGDIIMVEVN